MLVQITILDLVEEVLKNSSTPLTVSEIHKNICENKLDEKVTSLRGNTPKGLISGSLNQNIRKGNSKFIIVSVKPYRYALKDKVQNQPNSSQVLELEQTSEKIRKKSEFNERDLHPLLVSFLNSEFKIYSKTINHQESERKEKGENMWVHPDIVGVYFPFSQYGEETSRLTNHLACPGYKFYSFELKKELFSGNYRESYFQAVSNSSWTNEGYLVALEIDKKIQDELRRLNTAFGIGVIELGITPEDCKVIMPATYKESLDIATLDLLAKGNKSFKNFIYSVNEDIKSGKADRIQKDSYDEIMDKEEYKSYCKSNNIKHST